MQNNNVVPTVAKKVFIGRTCSIDTMQPFVLLVTFIIICRKFHRCYIQWRGGRGGQGAMAPLNRGANGDKGAPKLFACNIFG